jgi:hypothetical protein
LRIKEVDKPLLFKAMKAFFENALYLLPGEVLSDSERFTHLDCGMTPKGRSNTRLLEKPPSVDGFLA